MMYGFGDDQPAADTVGVMEELLIEHITDVASFLPQFDAATPLTRRRSVRKLTEHPPVAQRSKSTILNSPFEKIPRNSLESTSCSSWRRILHARGGSVMIWRVSQRR